MFISSTKVTMTVWYDHPFIGYGPGRPFFQLKKFEVEFWWQVVVMLSKVICERSEIKTNLNLN